MWCRPLPHTHANSCMHTHSHYTLHISVPPLTICTDITKHKWACTHGCTDAQSHHTCTTHGAHRVQEDTFIMPDSDKECHFSWSLPGELDHNFQAMVCATFTKMWNNLKSDAVSSDFTMQSKLHNSNYNLVKIITTFLPFLDLSSSSALRWP